METLRLITETNQWGSILPEIILCISALLLLGLDLFLSKSMHGMIPRFAMATMFFVLLWLFFFSNAFVSEPKINFGGMLKHTPLGEVMRVFFLLSSILVGYVASIYFKKQNLPHTEFYHILLIATVGLMLLGQSNHFIMLFVALELVSIAFYVLISYSRTSLFSLEAGLKYLILSGVSTAILLFSIVLIYGMSGNPLLEASTPQGLDFEPLAAFVSANSHNFIVQVGVILMISGVAFKIGAVPFQIWIPDVYQGAPTPVMSFLAVSSKAAGFIVLINLIKGPLADMAYLVTPLLSAMAIVTILFGNLTAIPQGNVKRLMGLSGIAHAGYLLIGVIAFYTVEWVLGAIIFYLYAYLIASFAVTSIMALVASENDEDQRLKHYENLSETSPFLGFVLAVGLSSLAGIPPLVGFITKLFIFIAAFQAQLYALLGVAVIGVVISIYYYFDWLRESFFFPWKRKEPIPAKSGVSSVAPALTSTDRIMLASLVVLTITLGIYQGCVGTFLFAVAL